MIRDYLHCIIFILSVSPVLGQPASFWERLYQPISSEGANWVIINYDGPSDNRSVIYSIRGDTLVDDIEYKKCYRRDYRPETYTSPGDLPYPYRAGPKSLFALVRDDTLTGEFFAKFVEPNLATRYPNDTLIHDYGANIGDTLRSALVREEATEIVGGYDSLQIFGRNRLVQKVMSQRDILVSGIGDAFTISGPFTDEETGLIINSGIRALVDYCVGNDEECGIVPISTNNQHPMNWEVDISVSPNPVQTDLLIKTSKSSSRALTYTIVDVQGHRIFSSSTLVGTSQQLKVDMSALPTGSYFLSITGSNYQNTFHILKAMHP
ncbi:T9SS type A sorting domain-containing protein [Lewinella sp. W8]|uniref:T9SS type A sorting domain-containing protein n=1 Tax=Lewinella sp. W8 TaxID=2528208 RepID=UPI001565D4CC|nr:T9SS type A sorting domain-containing protein [Lewinella sp. W8]